MVNVKTLKLLNNLPDFMSRSENSNNFKLLNSFAPSFKELSDNVSVAKLRLSVVTANGQFLNSIGRFFGLNRRFGENDNDFRSRILAFFQTTVFSSSKIGLRNSLSNGLNVAVGDIEFSNVVGSPNVFDVIIYINPSTNTSVMDRLAGLVDNGKAAGVKFRSFEVLDKGGQLLTDIGFVDDENAFVM